MRDEVGVRGEIYTTVYFRMWEFSTVHTICCVTSNHLPYTINCCHLDNHSEIDCTTRNGWCVRAVQSIKEWVVCACGAEH